MSTSPRRVALLAATAFALSAPLAPRALAASPPAIDAAGAQAIVDGVHALLVEMFGSFAPAASLLTATAKDDHYHIEIPVAHRWDGGSVGGDSAGADLTPLGDGRWQIANGKLPGRVELDLDHPAADAFKTAVATIKDFSLTGVIDTTLATESKLESKGQGFALKTTGADAESNVAIASSASTVTISPAQDGRVTLVGSDSEEGIVNTTTKGKVSFHSGAQKSSGSTRIEGLSLSSLRDAFHILSTMASLPEPVAGKPPDPATRKALHAFIAALADSMTAMTARRSEDGMTFDYGDMAKGSVDHAEFDVESSDKDGQAALALGFAVQGLVIPTLPPGPMTTFLPKHAALHVALSGLDSATLHKSLDEGVDDPSPDAAMGLLMGALAAHPANIAVDKFDVETGPAHITGQGTVTTNGPEHTEGHATIRVTGFDAAMKLLSADPDAKPAMSGLIFVKGLAKQDGDAMVWDVSYDGQKLLVNGIDAFGGPPKP